MWEDTTIKLGPGREAQGLSCSHALCAESQLLSGSPRKKAGNTKALWNYSGGRDDFIWLQESAVGK